jgi:cytochrome c-type biogenesis protein CcmH/NrfG
MFLSLNRPQEALQAYRAALVVAPGRLGALTGAAKAADLVGDIQAAKQMRTMLPDKVE